MSEYLFKGSLADFPRSKELPEGVKEICFKDAYDYHIEMFPRIEYARRGDTPLHIELLVPVDGAPYDPQSDYPLVIFVQGSGWQPQHLYQYLGDMVRMAEHGYAVGIVEYRPSSIAPIPAQAEDVKSAIRFLRKHGKEYRLKTDKIALWGDSSGGHTALLAGITGDDAPNAPDDTDTSAEVCCIVDWFAPTDLVEMCRGLSVQDHADPESNFGQAIGGYSALEHPEKAASANIMSYLSVEKPTPPILIMHGDRDHVVPFHQSCMLYQRLKELGKDVEMYKVLGAFHAFGGFHCPECLDIIISFVRKYL